MNSTEQARSLIEDAIAAIDSEREQLQRFLDHLNGSDGRSPTRRTARASGVRKRRQSRTPRKASRRVKRGQRVAEVLADIQAHPGTRPSETAGRLGIASTQVSATAAKLVDRGEVQRNDGRLSVAK